MKKFLGVIAPASLSLLCMSAGAQDVFSYTTTSNLVLNGTHLEGTGTTANYFETAYGASGALMAQAPTNLRLISITPMGNSAVPAVYNKTLSVSVNLTYNGDTKAFVFSPLTLMGSLSDAGSNTDSVMWGPFERGIITQNVGGRDFRLGLINSTNPGLIGSLGSDGTLSAFAYSVPEQGAVAMFIAVGVMGVFSTFKYIRRRK